ncbi:MAG: hypothetical protein R3F05_16925 [Planctomycetota bacterium]
MQLTSSGYERVLVALDEQAVRDAATQTVVPPIGGSLRSTCPVVAGCAS